MRKRENGDPKRKSVLPRTLVIPRKQDIHNSGDRIFLPADKINTMAVAVGRREEKTKQRYREKRWGDMALQLTL